MFYTFIKVQSTCYILPFNISEDNHDTLILLQKILGKLLIDNIIYQLVGWVILSQKRKCLWFRVNQFLYSSILSYYFIKKSYRFFISCRFWVHWRIKLINLIINVTKWQDPTNSKAKWYFDENRSGYYLFRPSSFSKENTFYLWFLNYWYAGYFEIIFLSENCFNLLLSLAYADSPLIFLKLPNPNFKISWFWLKKSLCSQNFRFKEEQIINIISRNAYPTFN